MHLSEIFVYKFSFFQETNTPPTTTPHSVNIPHTSKPTTPQQPPTTLQQPLHHTTNPPTTTLPPQQPPFHHKNHPSTTTTTLLPQALRPHSYDAQGQCRVCRLCVQQEQDHRHCQGLLSSSQWSPHQPPHG